MVPCEAEAGSGEWEEGNAASAAWSASTPSTAGPGLAVRVGSAAGRGTSSVVRTPDAAWPGLETVVPHPDRRTGEATHNCGTLDAYKDPRYQLPVPVTARTVRRSECCAAVVAAAASSRRPSCMCTGPSRGTATGSGCTCPVSRPVSAPRPLSVVYWPTFCLSATAEA